MPRRNRASILPFLALSTFPRVVAMMADNIDDYAAIGQAFTTDPGAVTASIQRLRNQAYSAGNLQTNQQQKVEVQQAAGTTTYVIQPANPQVVYVPVYDPTVIYVRPAVPVAVPLISFGIGIGIGWLVATNNPWGWGGWGWGWGPRGGVYYNRTVFVGWHGGYRPPNPWYRPRPVPYASRPGYGGNWETIVRAATIRRDPIASRPTITPGAQGRVDIVHPPPSLTRGPVAANPGNGRPGGSNPGNGRPGPPGTPGNGRPGGDSPGTPGNGGPGGSNPGNGNGRPGGGNPGTPGNGRRGGGNPGNGNGRPGGSNPGTPGNGRPGGSCRGGGNPGSGNNRPGGGEWHAPG